jgi:alpha-aminoadipate carrier protein LysW
MTDCIVCGSSLNLEDDIEVNEIIMCDECGMELEVVDTNPFSVQEAPEEEEDWGE